MDWDNLDGYTKAAILLNTLGDEASTALFHNLGDNDVRRIVNAMGKIKKVPVGVTTRILAEFYEIISEDKEYLFGFDDKSRKRLVKALGEDRAKQILGHLNMIGKKGKALEALEMVDARTLATFLVNEHPQTIALIVAHLDPEKKCEVIKRLPETVQGEVVMRVAKIDYISPELLEEVDRVLKSELSSMGTLDQQALGGVEPIAEMFNIMDKNTEQSIMMRIEEKDPALAEEIRKLMFVFEDLVKVDDKGIQSILKEVPNEKLILALKTASEDVKEKIFKNMSSRAALLVREDLEAMGPVRLSDVEVAQQEIVNIARRLEDEGKIIISRGGDEDTLV
ncbi:MAG: flagellar motor switch protein FliG [Oligoflexia bacterium]|nr:flagellar motor switch protein FliG [Oligoflexia bacterium]